MNEDKYIPTPAAIDWFMNDYMAKTMEEVAKGVSESKEKQVEN